MRKIILLSFLFVGIGLFMNAQTIATFEDLDEDLLYFSDYGTSGDPFWFDDGRFVEGGVPQIADNPDKSGINKSDKCLVAINVADADWWGNFTVLGLRNPITITEDNRYLHLSVYRSIQPKEFRIGFNDREEAGQVFQGKVANDAQWESVVCDLGARFMGEQLEYIHIVLSTNWSDPRTGWGVATYAFDDFALSSSPIPPSVTLMDGNGLFVGFENQEEIDTWVHELDPLNEENNASIISNPFGSSDIIGNKIVQFDKSANADWWQGYRVDFKGVMPVGEENPTYLHVLAYVPNAIFEAEDGLMNVDIQLCAKDHMGNENVDLFSVWDDETDQWHDLVLEITSIEYLKELTVRFDVRKDQDEKWIKSPANTFYLDAIAFDNNPDPREITLGLNQQKAEDFALVFASENQINVRTDKTVRVELFDILGKSIQTSVYDGNAVIPAMKGVYIVKISSTDNIKQISKVLVK